jgi:Zn ribbon nucleic-acid-binding protein
MAITRDDLERAAFWDQAVCLTCGHAQPLDQADATECVECGADDLLPAKRVLQIADFVEE